MIKLLTYDKTGDLGMGSKGQLPLDFFESVGICDGAPSNVFLFFMLLLSSADFFSKLTFSKQKIFQIRTDVLSVLIWVQTVCKSY